MNKVKYVEGNLFALPLARGGFAAGLIARATSRGPSLLADVFGPKLVVMPSLSSLSNLKAPAAIKVARVGDLHLLDGRWPIIGALPGFDRSDWPMPKFERRDEIRRLSWAVEYADDDPGRSVQLTPIEYCSGQLERDWGYSAGVLEEVATRRLEPNGVSS